MQAQGAQNSHQDGDFNSKNKAIEDKNLLSEDFHFEEPPVINMAAFLNRDDPEALEAECKKVAMSFHKFGICIVRDPRVNHEDNDTYIDMIENYFEHISADYYAGG